jgi:hypothetical protein
VADLTPALLNCAWPLLTVEARRSLLSGCCAAAAAAGATQQPAPVAASTAPHAARAAATLVAALEIVSFGQQRTFCRALATACAEERAACAASDDESLPGVDVDVESGRSEEEAAVALQRAARRAALAASAALAVRAAALKQGAPDPERRQPGSPTAGAAPAGRPSVLSRIATGFSTGLRLLFLAAMGDVSFFPEVWGPAARARDVNRTGLATVAPLREPAGVHRQQL